MRDSLALEAAFLRREEELLKYWWTEYAECSDGPNGSLKHTASIKHVTSTSSKANQETDHGTIDEERVGVPVKGGLYEVILIHIFLHVKVILSNPFSYALQLLCIDRCSKMDILHYNSFLLRDRLLQLPHLIVLFDSKPYLFFSLKTKSFVLSSISVKTCMNLQLVYVIAGGSRKTSLFSCLLEW